ncbi:MAG TPA: response regulator transcription factor [Candidatus Acidoferrum sp.]|nr:response regulator transcription factor [Candidatus Acidoferrum sp.]
MSKTTRVLVAEDDRRTARIVERYLRAASYDVTLAADGEEALALFAEIPPDLVVLDVMLPKIDGFEICRRIRREGNVPVIMLTARVGEDDRLRGLLGGADDYVVKPFSPREIVARVATVLRRAGDDTHRSPMQTNFGRLQLDRTICDALVDGVPLHLTTTEYHLLEALCTTPGAPWSRARLLERMFGWDRESSERTVDTHVANLRRKLRVTSGDVPRIVTVFGRGYSLAKNAAR